MRNFKISSSLFSVSKLGNGDCSWEIRLTLSFSSKITHLFSNQLSSTFCIATSILNNIFNPLSNSKIKGKDKYFNINSKTIKNGKNKIYNFRSTYKISLKFKELKNIITVMQGCFINSRTYQQLLTACLKEILSL